VVRLEKGKPVLTLPTEKKALNEKALLHKEKKSDPKGKKTLLTMQEERIFSSIKSPPIAIKVWDATATRRKNPQPNAK